MENQDESDSKLIEYAEGGSGVKFRSAQIKAMLRLKNSMNFSSAVMIILTIILVILTGVLIWQGF